MNRAMLDEVVNYDNEGINYDDIPEIKDFSKGRKNPHARKIKENGYSVTIHYTPEDVASNDFDDTKDILQALIELMPVNDAKRLLLHVKNNYNLPCSPVVWESLSGGGV